MSRDPPHEGLHELLHARVDPLSELPSQLVKVLAVRVDVADLEVAVARAVLLPVGAAEGLRDLVRADRDYRSRRSRDRSPDLAAELGRAHGGAGGEELTVLVPRRRPERRAEQDLDRPLDIFLGDLTAPATDEEVGAMECAADVLAPGPLLFLVSVDELVRLVNPR